MERIDLAGLQSLHTFGVEINFSPSAPREMVTFTRWLVKSLRSLPPIHPFNTLIFDIEARRVNQGLNLNEWYWWDLDETLCTPGRQVRSVFSFRQHFPEDDLANLHSFIASAFPLSTVMGLISFVWRGDL